MAAESYRSAKFSINFVRVTKPYIKSVHNGYGASEICPLWENDIPMQKAQVGWQGRPTTHHQTSVSAEESDDISVSSLT